MRGFTDDERATLRTLSSPLRIQDYLDSLAINHEKEGETCYSPRIVLREQKAHCLEGAMLAAAALAFHGQRPLLLNLRTMNGDDDHAVALFRVRGYYGALSKTNHAVLRYRDPVYKSIRELALSYFHEYFLDEDGKKTLRSCSRPLALRKFGTSWMTSEKPVWNIAYALWDAPHASLVPEAVKRHLRPATPFERQAAEPVEWPESDPRT